jgi:single-strand DNA-binding protein
MIKLQVIGNLGKDAVINQVNGKTVINFTVAHSEKYKDQQGQVQDRTVWVDCAFWTERAVGQYLLKGKSVFVEGTPRVELYTSKEGRQGASLRLAVSDMQFVGGNRDNPQQTAPAMNETNTSAPIGAMPVAAAPSFDSGATMPSTDDLPF